MAKIKQYRLLLSFILTCLSMQVSAQQGCKLFVTAVDTPANTITSLQLTTTFNSKTDCFAYVQKLPQLLIAKGYISASVENMREDTASIYLVLFLGKKYSWEQLTVEPNDWSLLNQLGFSNTTFTNKPFDQQQIESVYKKLLDYYSNNGYPFARISLDSMQINNNLISAKLAIDKGALYHIDTILLKGDAKISKDYITRYLGLTEKNIYQQDVIDRINTRLAELPFITQSQPANISMLNTGAEVQLSLQNRHSNQVNVLVGFLPSNPQVGGKLLVSGEANLNLRNPFGNGETLGVNWQQLQSKSPRLNLLFQRPYLFHSPLGINTNFELYKRDSFFLNIHALFGVQYNVSTKKAISVAIQLYRTNVLSIDTNIVKATKRLPDMIDLTTSTLSFQYDYNNTNYRFNPRHGNELSFSLGFGKKNIKQNNTILAIKDPSFNYASLYDTVQQKAYVLRSTLNAAHYFPIGRQAVFKTAVQGGWLQSPNYYQNELFQLGGFKRLRGFDEESIYTNRFLIATAEYRYLLGQNSWLFTFLDAARAAYSSNSGSYAHTYLGFGTGLAFETSTGIFNISWALGKRDDLNLDLRQSKIHIGFVSIF